MTRLVDDIDGSQAVTTLSFSLDGHSYEIDLSDSHLSALQEALAPFIAAARAVPNARRSERAPAPRTPAPQPAAPQPAAPKSAAPKTAAPKTAAPKTPTPGRAPAPNGRAVPAPDVVAAEVAPERPAAVGPAVDSGPFRQPSPGAASADPARPKRRRAPLVADPFKPQT
jgi:hypothetical protein